MRREYVWLLALPAGSAHSSPIVLNEVLYDPEGSDAGLEFVELASIPGADPGASLAGWVLETGNGTRPGEWTLAWRGDSDDRLSNGLFLVAEASVEASADAVVDLDLQNGPDACRLRGPGGESDLLGWGDSLHGSFFEGEPAADVSGRSLARLPDGFDTDHNFRDFAAAIATPGEFNAPEESVQVLRLAHPPEGWPTGAPWRFEWTFRNVGRSSTRARLRLSCDVHPGELLAEVRAPEDGRAIEPGETRLASIEVAPPSGVHLPRSEPAAPGAVAPWRGVGRDLRVNEVLSRPVAGESEWIEVASETAESVDLSNLRLADASGTRADLAGTLRPGAFVILAADAEATRRRWGVPLSVDVVEVSPWPSLNHSSSAGEAAERVLLSIASAPVASASLPGGATAGVSWEIASGRDDPDDPTRWLESLDRTGGTPGRTNSRDGDRPLPPGLGGRLTVLPSPFRPRFDGTALVVVRPRRPTERCRVRVFDSHGVRVAELAPWKIDDHEHRALWDGRHESGRDALLGLYVIRAEAPGVDETEPLVLAR